MGKDRPDKKEGGKSKAKREPRLPSQLPRETRDDYDGPSTSARTEKPSIGQLTSHIANKQKRSEVYQRLKAKAKKTKKETRLKRKKAVEKAEELGLEPPPPRAPRTIESVRVKDETKVEAGDEEIQVDENDDEFAEHFAVSRPPNVLITTCRRPTKIMFKFVSELLELFPCAMFAERRNYELKQICKYADNRGFSDVLVWNEDRKKINGLIHVHLPDGPTALYRVSSVKLSEDIKNCGRATGHKPELILNNFDTRLGRRVGRMLASLFHQEPQFRGRRVATFHNQRDFIFFRHHRYIFDEKEEDKKGKGKPDDPPVQTRLQELGPRFTLKLMALQKGTFNTKAGEFEWAREGGDQKKKFAL